MVYLGHSFGSCLAGSTAEASRRKGVVELSCWVHGSWEAEQGDSVQEEENRGQIQTLGSLSTIHVDTFSRGFINPQGGSQSNQVSS